MRATLLGLLAALATTTALRAQDTDIIRGRVTAPDSTPLENVTVSATSMSSQISRSTRTDRSGRYTLVFAGGGGDYLMSFTQLGYQRKQFEIKRQGDEAVLVADAKLDRAAVMLDPTQVTAQRERPNRNESLRPDIGGLERTVGSVPLDALGDIAAMVATLPGVTLIPGADGLSAGFSVLGLGVDQNSITLNGMNFSGGSLPRDAGTMMRLSTSTYDASRGGFSGGQVTMRSFGGSNFVNRSFHLSYDAPSLQWTDRVGTQLGQQYSNVQASGVMSGPIVYDKLFYNTSFQFGRRQSDLQTLLNTDAFTLERLGVSRDSVARALTTMEQGGIPFTTPGIPGVRQTNNGSFLSTLNFAPGGQHQLTATINGRWNNSPASMLSSTAVPAHGGDVSSWGGQAQLQHSGYFGFGILNEISGAFSTNVRHGDPYLSLPDARVRVTSLFADGTAGVSSLSLGGNSGLPQRSQDQSWQLRNETSWFTQANKHRVKLTEELYYNQTWLEQNQNGLGTFTYNSLADFESGTPSMFTRRLEPARRTGSGVSGAISLGDAWRKTPNLQIQYGVRLDGSDYSTTPLYNPAVQQVFNVRNDHVPSEFPITPRVGFTWNYGTAPQIQGFEGAFRGARGQFSGGFGEFHNLPGASLLNSAIDNTGLPNAAQQLTCVGSAVPTPDWSAFAGNPGAIPTQCLAANSDSLFANALPNVYLFAPDYRFQRSWRSNLAWNGQLPNTPILKYFRTNANVVYSRNIAQPGSYDLNFDGVARFGLADEGGRPVFVAPSSVVPTTGAIAARDARIAPEFNQVMEQRSDLMSDSRQLQLSVQPVRFSSSFNWGLTYTLSSVRDMVRGFGSNTDGDPRPTQWGRASGDVRHRINLNAGYTFKEMVNVSLSGMVASGSPFTPIVGGDVNGDGYFNDRAFIFNPAYTTDPVLADAMRTFLGTASGTARNCLTSQLGTIAGRNSCEGPWWMSLNSMTVSFLPQKLHLPQRAVISLYLNNPLTGIDALAHGTSNLRGWGQAPPIDPTLLYVRGFDPSAQRFIYDVNPRFADPRRTRNAFGAPFTITLDMRINVGPEPQRQQLSIMLRQGRGGRGEKLTEQQIKQRYARIGGNPLDQMLRQRDSLKLTQGQVDSLASWVKQYNAKVDSIWTPVAKYLASLDEKFVLDAAFDRVAAAQNATLDVLLVYGPKGKQLLNDEQVRKLPPFISAFLDEATIRRMRPGAGFAAFGQFGPG